LSHTLWRDRVGILDIKPGVLVELDEEVETLGHCTHGVVLGRFDDLESDRNQDRIWRVLCGGRIVILWEREFKVVE
jgi:hypothetical protein